MKTLRNIIGLCAAFMLSLVALPSHADDPRALIVSKASVSAGAASGVVSAATTVTSVTVPGAKLGDACIASHSVDTTGLAFSCVVTATDTAKVYTINTTTNGVALSSGTMRVFLLRKGTR
jgi:hypothetical protein